MFRGLALAFALCCGALAAAAPAHAGLLVESADDCTPQKTEKVFQRWLDPLNYVPVRGGDFEGGAAGWDLDGARVVAGNEPFGIGRDGGSRALSIPAGASATSPVMCAGLDHVVMRYVVKSSRPSLLGALTSRLQVEVIVETELGATLALPLGIQPVSTAWTPSLPVPVVGNLLPLLPGNHTPIAFRFTAVGSASWTVDEVQLDPRFRG